MSYRSAIRSALSLVAALLLSASANAQLFRAYVASDGNDTNPCTLPAPCRLLPAALAAVTSGGEIWMLDSANYNTSTVNITKSVTILAVPGALGSVVANGGRAINVNTPGVEVALRNLVIVPVPGAGGTDGIAFFDGTAFTVENCLVANLPGHGITVVAAANVQITDSTIRGNGNSGLALSGANAVVTRSTFRGNTQSGIHLNGAAANTTTADIADSTIASNGGTGIDAFSSHASAVLKLSVRSSQLARNDIGVRAASTAGASVTVSVSGSTVSNNLTGLFSTGAGARMWASGNTVSANTTGLLQSSPSVFESAGNNAVRNNGTNTSGLITVVLME